MLYNGHVAIYVEYTLDCITKLFKPQSELYQGFKKKNTNLGFVVLVKHDI